VYYHLLYFENFSSRRKESRRKRAYAAFRRYVRRLVAGKGGGAGTIG
jgi:hypothetical protein